MKHRCWTCWDIVAAQMLVAEEKAFFDQTRSDGALACSRRLGSDNQTDGDHGERVRAFAVQLFDKTKKLHGIPGKRRLLLECAALLHELGYRFNAQNASQTTYDLIRQAYLFGLNEEETRLVAGNRPMRGFPSGVGFSGLSVGQAAPADR